MRPYRADVVAVAACLAVLAAVLLPPPARAQEPEPETQAPAAAAEGPDLTQEIVEIENADPEALARVLRVFRVHVQAHPELGLITLKGSEEDVAVAVAAARRLDVPAERTVSVELVAHVLGASKERELSGGVPPSLEDVARQLREVFDYRGVRLVDSLILRARDRGAAKVSGVMSSGPGASSIPYELGINRITVVDGGDSREVRLDGLLFEALVGPLDPPARTDDPNRPRVRSDVVRLVTDLDVREGQKAVVGKAASGGEGREALILVIEARVMP